MKIINGNASSKESDLTSDNKPNTKQEAGPSSSSKKDDAKGVSSPKDEVVTITDEEDEPDEIKKEDSLNETKKDDPSPAVPVTTDKGKSDNEKELNKKELNKNDNNSLEKTDKTVTSDKTSTIDSETVKGTPKKESEPETQFPSSIDALKSDLLESSQKIVLGNLGIMRDYDQWTASLLLKENSPGVVSCFETLFPRFRIASPLLK